MDGFTRVAGPPIPRLSDLSSVVDPVSEAGGKPRRRCRINGALFLGSALSAQRS